MPVAPAVNHNFMVFHERQFQIPMKIFLERFDDKVLWLRDSFHSMGDSINIETIPFASSGASRLPVTIVEHGIGSDDDEDGKQFDAGERCAKQ